MALSKDKKSKDKKAPDNTEEVKPKNVNEESTKALHKLPVMIQRQYLKDLSFENPNAPDTLLFSDEKPTLDVNFSMEARKIVMEHDDNLYEVVLGVQATTKRKDKVLFLAEIEYGVVVSLGDEIPEEQVHPLLLIEMPRYMFPYVRQILASSTGEAGYMPLLLQPMDFKAFYMQRFGPDAQAAPQKETA